MTIHAVIWDMGGVIIRTEDWSYRERWQARTNRSAIELTNLVFEGVRGRQAQLGAATEDQVWQWVFKELELSYPESHEFRRDFYAGDAVDFELVKYIRKLQHTMRTGLLSNAYREARRWLEEEWKIADAFDQLLISAEVGIAKPDERIYHLALEKLGVSPQEAIFVDDSEANIEAAQKLGIHGIRFQSPEQAIGDLQALMEAASAS